METNMFNRRVFKKALITGISGSGGSYLAEYILENHKKVKVYGIYRKFNKLNLKNIKDKASLFKCNLNQLNSVKIILKKTPIPENIDNRVTKLLIDFANTINE